MNHQSADKTTRIELDDGARDVLKQISTLGSGVGFDEILNNNKLTANMEQLRTKKNMAFFEELSRTRDEFKMIADKVDQLERHVLDLKTASKLSI